VFAEVEKDEAARGSTRGSTRPRGLFRLVFPIFLMVMRRQEAANTLNLKKALERA